MHNLPRAFVVLDVGSSRDRCEKIGWNKLVLLRKEYSMEKWRKKVKILTHQNFSPHWRPPQLSEGTSDLPQNSTQKGLLIVTFLKSVMKL